MNRTSIHLIFVSILLTAGLYSAAAAETGTASWYGGKFQGRKTASGEIFDTRKLTAAHRTLPFGTMVEVTNTANGKSVVVRINDRGPFIQGRIIDLSQAAAERLDMIHTGTAEVRIEEIPAPIAEADTGRVSGKDAQTSAARSESEPPDDAEGAVQPAAVFYTVQVGSFSITANAENLLSYLHAKGFMTELEKTSSGITRVILPEVAHTDLDEVKNRLKAAGIIDILVRASR